MNPYIITPLAITDPYFKMPLTSMNLLKIPKEICDMTYTASLPRGKTILVEGQPSRSSDKEFLLRDVTEIMEPWVVQNITSSPSDSAQALKQLNHGSLSSNDRIAQEALESFIRNNVFRIDYHYLLYFLTSGCVGYTRLCDGRTMRDSITMIEIVVSPNQLHDRKLLSTTVKLLQECMCLARGEVTWKIRQLYPFRPNRQVCAVMMGLQNLNKAVTGSWVLGLRKCEIDLHVETISCGDWPYLRKSVVEEVFPVQELWMSVGRMKEWAGPLMEKEGGRCVHRLLDSI